MGPIGRAQITFAIAAKAAGITEKQLRNWLDKGQVLLQGDDERSEGQWRRFSLIDVVRLGIIGAIVRYGVQVAHARDIITSNVDSTLATLARYQNTPRGAVAAALTGVTILVTYDVEEGQLYGVRLTYGPGDEPDFEGLRHFLFIDVGQIASDVLERLDADDDDAEG